MKSHVLTLLLCGATLCAQSAPTDTPVVIRVDAAARQSALRPAWAYFGYDEPNYTYTPNGSKLIGELAAASPVPVHVRAHHLLVTGDGTAALKWGSTNVYTEDAQGTPIYDFTIIDRIFDTYVGHGAKPFVELGFMPEALSVHPQPYMRHWRQPNDGDGWAYTARDYRKWAGLIEALVQHCLSRYGRAEAGSWYWELWNESDPEGCAACSSREYPKNAYRNGPLYPSYLAVANNGIMEIAARRKADVEGILTWAFLFEGQPYFDGFRTLATNGIDKPVLNYFRMAGLMRGDRVAVTSTGAVPLDAMLKDGVRGPADINGLASRADREISVMVWNYHDDDVAAPDAPVRIEIAGLPKEATRVLVRHYRIDRDHSNAFTAWQRMGSPQQPTPEQYRQLEAAGQLELLESPRFVQSRAGAVSLPFALPRQGLSLVQVGW